MFVEQSAASRHRVALPHAVPWWELAARAGAARPHANIPKTSRPSPPTRPHTHTLLGNHFYNQPLRESRLPAAPGLQRVQPACQGLGGEAGSGPAPPKHSHILCVLVTLETGTLDSVATGFVSSHTEFWAAEPKAQWAQPYSWQKPLGSCGRASDVVSKNQQAC